MQADWPILSVLVWLPIAAGVLLLALGERRAEFGRWVGLLASLATFAAAAVLWRDFDRGIAAMQFVEREPWIGAFNTWYHLGPRGLHQGEHRHGPAHGHDGRHSQSIRGKPEGI